MNMAKSVDENIDIDTKMLYMDFEVLKEKLKIDK